MVERVLDIGIGRGGGYINEDLPGTLRVGVDVLRQDLWVARYDYPQLQAVQADAASLPFADNSFQAIEMRLPDPFKMIITGLAPIDPSLPEDGWYPEFARVLKPNGRVRMWCDPWADPDAVIQASEKHFSVVGVDEIRMEDIMDMDTKTGWDILYSYAGTPRRNPYFFTYFNLFTLQKK